MRKVENKIQCEIIKYCRAHYPLKLAFHVDNGHAESVGEAMQAKRMGRLSGIPDLCIPLQNGGVLWLELKTKSGHLSKIQKERHAQLEKQGHLVKTTYGLMEAIALLEKYVYS